MKKLLSAVLATVMLCMPAVGTSAEIQDDVYRCYSNELNYLNNTNTIDEYCVYDINKDGYKELIVKLGTCEADYIYRFYGCEYGKIVALATLDGGHSALYECDTNGVFIYQTHMGTEALYKAVKTEKGIEEKLLFANDLNPLFEAGNEDPWHAPKKPIAVTYVSLDGFSLAGLN